MKSVIHWFLSALTSSQWLSKLSVGLNAFARFLVTYTAYYWPKSALTVSQLLTPVL